MRSAPAVRGPAWRGARTAAAGDRTDSSRLLVPDASDLDLPPVATVHLPRRVPAMIHGSWIPDTVQ
ncbi:carotenoid oxygenase family protein [Streptomyces sp. MMS24-I29]|uniref:carotenoid oxygenase family protein n=1 Tax=Streptomyces sp. MMS24-I29 TaxID=3351480 RepID=UPI003C7E963F